MGRGKEIMIRPPDSLGAEMMRLVEKFLHSQPVDENDCFLEDEEVFDRRMNEYVYSHASELLRLYLDYRNWVGDEHQLCDGKGNYLGGVGWEPDIWIQDWDVSEDGYCLYSGTNQLILNNDGTPIKNPELDIRVERLYFEESIDI